MLCDEGSGETHMQVAALPDLSPSMTHSSMSRPGLISFFGCGSRSHRFFPDFERFDWSDGGFSVANSTAMRRSVLWWRIVEVVADIRSSMATFHRVGAHAPVCVVRGAITVITRVRGPVVAHHGREN